MKILFIFIICICNTTIFCNNITKLKIYNKKTLQKKGRLILPARNSDFYSHLCEKKDLLGLWKTIKWTPYFLIPLKAINKPAFLKYQWYQYKKDGSLNSFCSKIDKTNNEILKSLNNSTKKVFFKFEETGMIQITAFDKKNNTFIEFWRCAIVTKNISDKNLNIDLQKGDILLSLISKKNKILYTRQIRQWKLNSKQK